MSDGPLEPSASPTAALPLGAVWDGRGTTFRVVSEAATDLWLCLFDEPAGRETARFPMILHSGGVWQVSVADVGPGQLYGFRADGPYAPEAGLRFNPARLLFDPYARSYRGEVRFHPSLEDQPPGSPGWAMDSAPYVPKAEVMDPAFEWGNDRPPSVPWSDTVIYEAHGKGLTARHPEVPEDLRGTFAGLAHEAVLEHLLALGVTSVELLPVFYSVTEERLETLGLTNYWGYNPLAFFAPDRRFSAVGDPARELKGAIRALHEAGLEILLDVAYNHTAEGGGAGPVLSLKGLDGRYYRLGAGHENGGYENLSGCGNTLDIRHPPALALVLDSLRFWVEEFHVDGFRFDLAPILGRSAPSPESPFDPRAPFFRALEEDPVLSRVKWIAEPWDLGRGGYSLGRFPKGWAQWNDRYRDTVRSFWRGDRGQVPELAARLTGSADLFSSPAQTVNFVACHDGFTLRDLVSYEEKHNRANGEEGRDGHGDNRSRNWGEEGRTASAWIEVLRSRAQRNLLATLAFSRGVPMLGHGDELGRTQEGNNNAYCHDSPLTWVSWPPEPAGKDLLAFTREVFRLRRLHPVLRRNAFFEGPSGTRDRVRWLLPSGVELTDEDWAEPRRRALAALFLPGDATTEPALLLLLNAGEKAQTFSLPEAPAGPWRVLLDTAAWPELPGARTEMAAYSLRLLRAG